MDMSRRGFLRGRSKAATAPLRPPWALAEAAFIEACTRCGVCVEKCPTGILVGGNGSFPVVDFQRGECDFCGECLAACGDHALLKIEAAPPWHIAPVIAASCIAQQNVVCRSCGDYCPPQALRFRPRIGSAAVPELDAAVCTGCGACVAVCPAQAITIKSTQHSKQEGAMA